ncbi:MAG: hypothetical protein H0X51_06130 [Parachlamydiaceae bacterium]|nr:hypothetical protein [Parachlamydiaceae bacterium]
MDPVTSCPVNWKGAPFQPPVSCIERTKVRRAFVACTATVGAACTLLLATKMITIASATVLLPLVCFIFAKMVSDLEPSKNCPEYRLGKFHAAAHDWETAVPSHMSFGHFQDLHGNILTSQQLTALRSFEIERLPFIEFFKRHRTATMTSTQVERLKEKCQAWLQEQDWNTIRCTFDEYEIDRFFGLNRYLYLFHYMTKPQDVTRSDYTCNDVLDFQDHCAHRIGVLDAGQLERLQRRTVIALSSSKKGLVEIQQKFAPIIKHLEIEKAVADAVIKQELEDLLQAETPTMVACIQRNGLDALRIRIPADRAHPLRNKLGECMPKISKSYGKDQNTWIAERDALYKMLSL